MYSKYIYRYLLAALVCLLLSACRGSDFSTAVAGSEGPLVIYPDYKDVTIPANIAPLNFRYAMEDVRKASTTFTIDGKSVTIKGAEVEWPLGKWKAFLADAAGKTISVTAEATVGGQTVKDSWSIFVSEDAIDGWLTYRLIEPAYQMWNEVSIMERHIEDFSETVICDYRLTENSCMNCHVHGQQRGDLSIYYIRGPKGGAILNRDGKLRKLTLNADGMLSGTVYGEIHPSGRFGVFSTNIILPGLHTVAGKRMEVYDTASDLTVADFDRNEMINLPHVARADAFETFPCFSADGNSVFWCVADTLPVPQKVDELLYSLVRADFDAGTGYISAQVDTIWSAGANNASVCHPKASPDGRWLMFTVADYGTFPLFHTESTLWLAHLMTGEVKALDSIKGDKSDTFHSWSSNSRWFVFASKRGDGHYGKPYFCHLDTDGNPTKPFVLPQKSARFYDYNLKSFNIPDLAKASTGMTPKDARRMYKAASEPFTNAGLNDTEE
ncbi:MAG: PD40 domain-containing protein [Bacteroidales bacterium]|nr:PD40 domain-containing protein [Bacteroidales bacterium]